MSASALTLSSTFPPAFTCRVSTLQFQDRPSLKKERVQIASTVGLVERGVRHIPCWGLEVPGMALGLPLTDLFLLEQRQLGLFLSAIRYLGGLLLFPVTLSYLLSSPWNPSQRGMVSAICEQIC